MKTLHSVINYVLVGIHALLAFLLLFENSVEIPFWLNPIGRMHPLLLHLPIGLLFLAVLLWVFRKEFGEASFHKVSRFVLALTAVSAATAALMGFFLSTESGYSGETVTRHKWFGVALSVVCYGLYAFYNQLFARKNTYPVFLGIGSVLLIVTGHLGANLTHGEEFLFEAFTSTEEKQFTPENTMYEAIVFPIFEAKCVACHNDNKIKGELNMASVAKMLKGGKNGPIWIAGDADNSHFIQHITMSMEEKEHMPPRGKTQLTNNEILILTAWVNSGAETDIAIKDYADSLDVKQLALKKLSGEDKAAVKTYDFDAVSASVIEEVNTPFCTVAPIANGSPALKVDFYVAQRFDRETLKNLSKVEKQIVELNLSKMPLSDEDLTLISGFRNLEKLILNGTDITGKNLDELLKLENLVSLAVSNTKVNVAGLTNVLSLPGLKEVFLWSSDISEEEINKLSSEYKQISFDKGYIPDESEMIVLNAPVIKNEERVIVGEVPIEFSHPLPGVILRYTTDGSDPDSASSSIYTKPFIISDFTMVKAIAVKEGWFASEIAQKSFYKSNFKASSVDLLTSPNPQYKASGAVSLTDLKLGDKDNFKDMKWLGFINSNLEAIVSFTDSKKPKAITVNYLLSISGYIMPPTDVEVWGSDDKNSWKLINTFKPQPAKAGMINQVVGANVSLKNTSYNHLKVIAKPLKKLPKWHQGAGEPAWIFVDEIFFN